MTSLDDIITNLKNIKKITGQDKIFLSVDNIIQRLEELKAVTINILDFEKYIVDHYGDRMDSVLKEISYYKENFEN